MITTVLPLRDARSLRFVFTYLRVVRAQSCLKHRYLNDFDTLKEGSNLLDRQNGDIFQHRYQHQGDADDVAVLLIFHRKNLLYSNLQTMLVFEMNVMSLLFQIFQMLSMLRHFETHFSVWQRFLVYISLCFLVR